DTISAPDAFEPPPTALAELPTICEKSDFNGATHGDQIHIVTAFALSPDLPVAPWGPTSQRAPYEYDANQVGGGDVDLEWNGPTARCPDCEGQGRRVVIGSTLGFEQEGDAEHGGVIALCGFEGHGEFILESAVAVDSDDYEPPMYVVLDGVVAAQSSQLGDGSVEKIFSGQSFSQFIALTAGTEAFGDDVNWTGAWDD